MMKSVIKLMVIFVFALLFISPDSNAQSTKEQIEELKQQIEAMRVQHQQQIEQLQQQIDLLDAAREDDKEAVAEIQEEQKDARKEPQKDLWYNDFKAKYKKGLFFHLKTGTSS